MITVHVPMTRTTRGLINAAAIERMKPGVMLLNVARGGILDEQDVADALKAGRIAGAAVDVFEAEPPTGSPLLEAPNTLLTPHLGASTAEAQVAVAEEVAEQILEVLDGRPARYAVNAPLLTPETAQAIAPYLPLAETLGRFLGQFAHAAPRTLTLEIAGEPAAYDASPLVAAVLRGLLETVDDRARQPRQRRRPWPAPRGIRVVERKTSTAAPFSSLLTVTAEGDGQSATVAGTVANGEPHIVRLDEHAMDLAPSDSMLITRHRDRPGTMGRIGVLLGEADVNISGDDPRPVRAACRRVHGPRARRRRPRRGRRVDPQRPRGDRRLDDPPRRRAVTAEPDPAPLIPEGLDATLVLLRHGESEWIREGRFQGQAETPLSDTGRRQAALAGARLAAPHASPDAPGPRQPPARDRPLAAGAHDRDGGAGRGGDRRGRCRGRRRRTRARAARARDRSRSARATGRARPTTRSPAAGPRSSRHGGAGPTRRGHPAASRWPRSRRAARPALAAILERLGRDYPRGSLDRPQVGGYRGAGPDARQPWSILVGHDGVFKVVLLTLFDIPLSRFWTFSFALCGISVVEFRGGRAVLRAHNLTEHLAPMLDEEAQAEAEARTRSGAL